MKRSAGFARLASLLACALGLACQTAAAQQGTRLDGPANPIGLWGANFNFVASGPNCDSFFGISVGLMALPGSSMGQALVPCSQPLGQPWTTTFEPLGVLALEPGWQHFRTWPMPSNLVSVRMDAEFSFARPEGPVNAGISTHDDFSVCNRRSAQWFERESSPLPPPPPNVRTPYETVAYTSGECSLGKLDPSWGPPLGLHRQWLMMQLPEAIPAQAMLWVYEQSGTGYTWRKRVRECDFTCLPGQAFQSTGRTASALVAGNTTSVFAAMALAVPQKYAKESPLQDLWWGGEEQGGWGLNVAKNGDRLFLTLFIYDADGRPQWAVMPEGQWDPRENVYYGDLYIPRGAPVAGYDNNKFDMGRPVGTGSLSFSDDDTGHFDYTIDNQSGGKKLRRFVFAPRAAEPSPYAGMWWGGLGQEGWGVSVQQQGEVMFATLYTYEPDGRTTWYYMPAGRRTGAAKYAGELYRSRGAAWVGQHYQGTSTRVAPVGSFELDFTSAGAATMTVRIGGTSTTRPLARFAF